MKLILNTSTQVIYISFIELQPNESYVLEEDFITPEIAQELASLKNANLIQITDYVPPIEPVKEEPVIEQQVEEVVEQPIMEEIVEEPTIEEVAEVVEEVKEEKPATKTTTTRKTTNTTKKSTTKKTTK